MRKKSFFETPLFAFFGKLADLVWLNMLTILSCIPILTAGAAITACHYAMNKIRQEESYVTQSFRRGLKENIHRTILLFLFIGMCHSATIGMFFVVPFAFQGFLLVFLKAFIVLFEIGFLMLTAWVFPLQARFSYSTQNLLISSFLLAIQYPLRTIGMLLLWVPPIAILMSLKVSWYVVFLFFGISIPVFLSSKIYDSVFADLEEKIREKNTAINANESLSDKELDDNSKE